jgi:hypothetical protein
MRKRLARLVGTLACVVLPLAVMVPTASAFTGAHTVTPQLCYLSCGGKWGAYEHAKVDFENRFHQKVTRIECHGPFVEKEPQTAQWICEVWGETVFEVIDLNEYGEERP